MIPEVLEYLRPGAQWVVEGDTYQGITWLDAQQTCPSESEVLAAIDTVKFNISVQKYELAVQKYMDKTAQAKGYDGILSACSYAASSNATFGPQGRAALNWRDQVWSYCYSQFALIKSGQRTAPATIEAFISELPNIVWP